MNGTMIDDMHFHTRAWYKVLNELGAGLSMEQTKLHMYGKAEEMFDRVFGPDKFNDQQLHEIILNKELAYQEEFRPYLQLINGLGAFFCKRPRPPASALPSARPLLKPMWIMYWTDYSCTRCFRLSSVQKMSQPVSRILKSF